LLARIFIAEIRLPGSLKKEVSTSLIVDAKQLRRKAAGAAYRQQLDRGRIMAKNCAP
jgi:hypothetical protein